MILFICHAIASAPDAGSCPPTAPPVLGAKCTCHGRGACAAGGAPRRRPPVVLRSGSMTLLARF